ncbi:hypothetical protein ACQ3I4_08295 [Zafaria sp. Z1313]|uniref:hypothetical protein n=1 Tax=unclassified Zafaria TaxID=2828765 RepID=UPI002E794DA9|nr:hypothetical protein [Zafaria sp. J156]MEE1620997.1 hypothetical protein [Zafaria sp. J156]
MSRTTVSPPAARPGPRRALTGAALAGLLALTACGSQGPGTGDDDGSGAPASSASSSAPPSASGSASPGPGAPTESTPAPEPSADAGGISMEGWKTWSKWDLSFKYPAQWSVEWHPYDVENEYSSYDVFDARGKLIATFAGVSATDTDGDMGTYEYTDLERTPLPGFADGDPVLMFEHMDITQPDDLPEGADVEDSQRARLMLTDEYTVDQRGDRPTLSGFRFSTERNPDFVSAEGFLDFNGIDPTAVTVDQAREFMKTERYRALRQMMLSLEYTG